MASFRRHYGAGPFHLLGVLACAAVALYAVSRVLDQGGFVGIALWFAFCILAHDLIGWPVYTAVDRWLVRRGGRTRRPPPVVPWVNHVRVPVIISGVLLGISFPLVLRLSSAYYAGATGFSEDVYLTNWLLVSAALAGASALVYLVRLGLARRPTP